MTTPDSAHVDTAYSLATSGSQIGTVVTVTDQAGKLRRSITNALGQLARVDEPDNSSSTGSLGAINSPNQDTVYAYDLLNNLTTVTQGSQTRSFTYDALSRLKSATNPESGTINYTYDNNNNLATKTDARGIVTTYTYDRLNRVSLRGYTNEPSGSETPDVYYFYDNLTNAKGKLIRVSSSVSTTEYTGFDILGRVTASKQTTDGVVYGEDDTANGKFPMTYTYNLSGALIEQQYPSGRVVKNVLDSNGDLAMTESKKNSSSGYWSYANGFTYNAAGAVTSMQLGNGRWESTVFNSRLQPTQIALGTVQSGYDLLKLNYSYGDWVSGSVDATKNNGNIVQQVITVPTVGASTGFAATQKYYYDSLNRIDDATEDLTPTGGSSTQTWRQDFSYDRYGNRNFVETNTTTLPHSCGTSPNFTVCTADQKKFNPSISSSNNNRLSSSDGYAFDSSGNMTTDTDSRTFIYDGENKQVEVKNSSSQTIGQYSYDGSGQRVKKYVPDTGETTVFVYNATGKQIAEYSSIVANSTDAKVSYLTNDRLGSPRINTDANGAVTARHDYHPFGEEVATSQRVTGLGYSGDTVRKQFTGYERDSESSLDYAKARMFGYTLGRFISPDPLANSGKPGIPQSWNRYSYVLNNPQILTDPTGMTWGYYMDGNKRYFHWFDGKVGKFEGHKYSEWTGSRTLYFHGEGFLRLTDNGHMVPVEAASTRSNRAQPAATKPASSPVNHDMVKSIADHTEPIPRALLELSAISVVAGTGGAACLINCPALFGTIGAGGTEYALTHPEEVDEAVEELTITFGRNANQISHVFRHLGELGLNEPEVQAAIQQDLQTAGQALQPGQPLRRVIEVGGQQIQYNAWKLADGTINVGRINGPPFNTQ